MRLNNYLKRTFALFCFLIGFSAVENLFALKVPELRGRVNDYANIIKRDDKAQIEEMLVNIESKTGAQIAVLTLKTLEDESLEEFSLKVAETWGLGQSGKDNGVLLLVSMDEHAIRIETGYGVEEFLTDAKCGLIIRNIIVPEFQKTNYSTGIKKAVENIGGLLIQDETLIDESVLNEYFADEDESDNFEFIISIIILIIAALFYILPFGKKGRYYSGRSHSSSHSYHSSSHHSYSGGGGHFGGGGASGHW